VCVCGRERERAKGGFSSSIECDGVDRGVSLSCRDPEADSQSVRDYSRTGRMRACVSLPCSQYRWRFDSIRSTLQNDVFVPFLLLVVECFVFCCCWAQTSITTWANNISAFQASTFPSGYCSCLTKIISHTTKELLICKKINGLKNKQSASFHS